MQFQADILSAEVVRSRWAESTVLGAAYLAGLACGYYPDTAAIEKNRLSGKLKTFKPAMEQGERLSLLSGWKSAVEKARLK